MEAAAEGQLDVVVALINELQVDRLRRDARGANCLHYAAENGRVKVVNWLVEDGGMQISAVDAQGQTAMHYAAKGAHSSGLEALRSLSSKIVNCKDNRGVTPLMLLVEASDDPRLLDRFVRYGAAVNAVDEEGETVLMHAARMDHAKVCSQLIVAHKVDTGLESAAGKTAMAIAEENGCSLTLNVLANIGLGADGASGIKWERNGIARQDSRVLWEVGTPKSSSSNSSKRMKVMPKAKDAKAELPAGVPAELVKKFERQGRDKRPKKCGACRTCLKPSLNAACLLMRYFGDSVKTRRARRQQTGSKAMINSRGEEGKETASPVTPDDGVFETAFYEAVEDGDSRTVCRYLDQGFDVDQAHTDNEGTTAIMYASLSGKKELLELLLERGGDVNAKDIHGTTALMCAAQGGHHELVRFLCSPDKAEFSGLPLDPNVVNLDGDTALHFAAEAGHRKVVDVLLSFGADPMLQNNDHQTAEMAADMENHEETSRVLREARLKPASPGPEPLNPNPVQATPDPEQASPEPEPNPRQNGPIASNGTQLTPDNVREARKETMSLTANQKQFLRFITKGDRAGARKLVQKEGISVETRNKQGTTALMIVCMDGDRGMFDFLLKELHANPSAEDENGMTVLMHAAQEGNVDLAKDLVEVYQVRVNPSTEDGDTALMYAAQSGHIDTVRLLVKHGAILDAEDNDGRTSLMLAAEGSHVEVVRYLMRKGAKISPEWLVKLASKND